MVSSCKKGFTLEPPSDILQGRQLGLGKYFIQKSSVLLSLLM